jgi:hypothetical protein
MNAYLISLLLLTKGYKVSMCYAKMYFALIMRLVFTTSNIDCVCEIRKLFKSGLFSSLHHLCAHLLKPVFGLTPWKLTYRMYGLVYVTLR